MIKKLYIGAITLVIVGLLITSATGMKLSTQTIRAEEQNNTMDRDYVIAQYLSGEGNFKNLDNVHMSDLSAMSSRMTAQPAQATISSMPSQTKTTYMATLPNYINQNTRADYQLYELHPGIADRLTYDHLLLTYRSEFVNLSNPTETENLVAYSGSINYGLNFSDPIGFISGPGGSFLNRQHPSATYWGKNATLDRWNFTYRPDAVEENTGEIHVGDFETDETTLIDLQNADVEIRYWDYSTSGFSDVTEPQIACSDANRDWFWGVMTLGIKKNGILQPGFFYQQNGTGWGSLMTPQSPLLYTGGNDASIDQYDDAWTWLTWGVRWPTGTYCWLVHYNDVPGMTNTQLWGWGDHDF